MAGGKRSGTLHQNLFGLLWGTQFEVFVLAAKISSGNSVENGDNVGMCTNTLCSLYMLSSVSLAQNYSMKNSTPSYFSF